MEIVRLVLAAQPTPSPFSVLDDGSLGHLPSQPFPSRSGMLPHVDSDAVVACGIGHDWNASMLAPLAIRALGPGDVRAKQCLDLPRYILG